MVSISIQLSLWEVFSILLELLTGKCNLHGTKQMSLEVAELEVTSLENNLYMKELIIDSYDKSILPSSVTVLSKNIIFSVSKQKKK